MKNPTNPHEPPFRTPPPPVSSIEDLCAKIQRRAMRSRRVMFHVSLNRYTERLTVVARNPDHNPMAPASAWEKPLMAVSVRLGDEDAVEQLEAVLEQMRDLGRKV